MTKEQPDRQAKPRWGVVVIGRNEGIRLERCLVSLSPQHQPVVYVDSGSTDDSVGMAKRTGADVVELDMSIPFTAARARNAGFERLMLIHPHLEYVQFVDGDCEVSDDWLSIAAGHLDDAPGTAIVCGLRRERHPEASIYNQICDLEWNGEPGHVEACGGDFMVRTAVFREVNGFNAALAAGEDPEFGYRVRLAGWKIFRIERTMTVHDAAIYRFSQWLRRSTRSGFAYAARAWLHRHDGTRYCWRENGRIFLWGGALPAVILSVVLAIGPAGLILVGIYPLQIWRCYRHERLLLPKHVAILHAIFLVAGKSPEFFGQLVFAWRRLLRRDQALIEYK
jgi:glycosyltransferase involved in cell wall biosynthesis